MQTIIICCAALACTASAFTPAGSAPSAAFGARLLRQQQRFERVAALQATLDYNDPLVKAEYTAAQALEGDDLQMASRHFPRGSLPPHSVCVGITRLDRHISGERLLGCL